MKVSMYNTKQKETHKLVSEVKDYKKYSKEIYNIMNAIDEAALVAVTDKDGTITYANEMFCKISKYTEEELLGLFELTVGMDGHRQTSPTRGAFRRVLQVAQALPHQVLRGLGPIRRRQRIKLGELRCGRARP